MHFSRVIIFVYFTVGFMASFSSASDIKGNERNNLTTAGKPIQSNQQERRPKRIQVKEACVACRKAHHACSGENRCARCLALNLVCSYSHPRKKRTTVEPQQSRDEKRKRAEVTDIYGYVERKIPKVADIYGYVKVKPLPSETDDEVTTALDPDNLFLGDCGKKAPGHSLSKPDFSKNPSMLTLGPPPSLNAVRTVHENQCASSQSLSPIDEQSDTVDNYWTDENCPAGFTFNLDSVLWGLNVPISAEITFNPDNVLCDLNAAIRAEGPFNPDEYLND